jgi:hypothetical protein
MKQSKQLREGTWKASGHDAHRPLTCEPPRSTFGSPRSPTSPAATRAAPHCYLPPLAAAEARQAPERKQSRQSQSTALAELDNFEAKLCSAGPGDVAKFREQLSTSTGECRLSLTVAKLAAASPGRSRNRGAEIPRIFGIFVSWETAQVTAAFRRFCVDTMPSLNSSHEETEAALFGAVKKSAPFCGGYLPRFLISEFLESCCPGFSKDFYTEASEGLATAHGSAFVETRRAAQQTSAMRFSAILCCISDNIAPATLQRNIAFFVNVFDTARTGKVPQHVVTHADFVRKFALCHVWPGVRPAWIVLCDVLEQLNANRETEELELATMQASAISSFTWAVETFVGVHDRHRTKQPGSVSKRTFGVPTADIRAVILSVPDLVDAFAKTDLRYDVPML